MVGRQYVALTALLVRPVAQNHSQCAFVRCSSLPGRNPCHRLPTKPIPVSQPGCVDERPSTCQLTRPAGEDSSTTSWSELSFCPSITTQARSVSQVAARAATRLYTGSKTAGLMIDRQQLGLTALEVRSASQDPGQNSHVGLPSPPKARRVSLGPS